MWITLTVIFCSVETVKWCALFCLCIAMSPRPLTAWLTLSMSFFFFCCHFRLLFEHKLSWDLHDFDRSIVPFRSLKQLIISRWYERTKVKVIRKISSAFFCAIFWKCGNRSDDVNRRVRPPKKGPIKIEWCSFHDEEVIVRCATITTEIKIEQQWTSE